MNYQKINFNACSMKNLFSQERFTENNTCFTRDYSVYGEVRIWFVRRLSGNSGFILLT